MDERERLLAEGPREAPEPTTVEPSVSGETAPVVATPPKSGTRPRGRSSWGRWIPIVLVAAVTGARALGDGYGGAIVVAAVLVIGLVEYLREAQPLMDDRPRYMISVAADLVGMHPQTLRIYEQRGLVRPRRTAGNTRLYSDEDVERLRSIQRLTTEVGLNLAGVEHVLRLEDELARMHRRLALLERDMRETVAEVHRAYRRDLVPYRPEQGLVPRRV